MTMHRRALPALALSLAAVTARAQNPAAVVEGFHNALLEIMRNAPRLGVRGRYDRLAPVMSQVFDLVTMTRIAVGPPWTGFTATDQAALSEAFEQLAEVRDEDPVLYIEQREITARRKAGGVVWFDFKWLCGGPRSQNDYLELASRFHTMILSNVPQMQPRMASEARRFTWLVDVLYDRRVKLIVSAEVAPEQLYPEGPLAHEFPRTVSRLNEMQSAEFLALERRDVDTALT